MGAAMSYAICIGIPLLGGSIIGQLATKGVQGWYKGIKKPAWNPPNWIFPAVWPLLYIAMGVASGMVYNKGGFQQQALPLGLYLGQLALNFAWQPIFFLLERPKSALVEVLLLDATAVAATVEFQKVVPLAGYLMYPYLAWLAFATALNASIVRLNPDKEGRGSDGPAAMLLSQNGDGL